MQSLFTVITIYNVLLLIRADTLPVKRIIVSSYMQVFATNVHWRYLFCFHGAEQQHSLHFRETKMHIKMVKI